jgi:hypothetical protein
MTTNYYFEAVFTKLGVGTAPSAAPLITVVDIADNVLVNAQAVTALVNLAGGYVYTYAGADNLQLIGKFVTTDVTVDQLELYVDPTISSVAYGIVTMLADYARRTGDYSTLTAAQVWDRLTSALTTAGSIGKLIVDYLDAAISSRATPDDVSVAISSTTAETVSSGSLSITTAYTTSQTITSTLTQDLSTATKLWLAVKANITDLDAESLVFIEKTDGLTILGGTTYATIAHGSLTVSGSSGDWEILIAIDEVATALLSPNSNCLAALKAIIDGNALSVWEGTCVISNGRIEAVL